MPINIRMHRVTDPREFATDFIQTGGQPTRGFAPSFGGGEARLIVHVGLGGLFDLGTEVSLRAGIAADGRSSIDIPEFLSPRRGHLLVSRRIGIIPGINFPSVLQPIYRTADFSLDSPSDEERSIFVLLNPTPDGQGLGQDRLNTELEAVRADRDLDSLRGTVRASDIRCRAKKSGAEISFDIELDSVTTHDLAAIIRATAEEIDVDLPGLDFITGLCADEDDIERQVSRSVRSLSAEFSQGVVEAVREEAGGLPIDSFASLTITRIRFPVVGEADGPFGPIPLRSIVPDVAVGLPRALMG